MARDRRGAANGRGLPRRSAAPTRLEAAAPTSSLLEPSGRPGQARSVDPGSSRSSLLSVDLERYRKYGGWSLGRQGLVLERYRWLSANDGSARASARVGPGRPVPPTQTTDRRVGTTIAARSVGWLAWVPFPARATDETPGGRAAARTRHRSEIREGHQGRQPLTARRGQPGRAPGPECCRDPVQLDVVRDTVAMARRCRIAVQRT
jgi:hypothetical protein